MEGEARARCADGRVRDDAGIVCHQFDLRGGGIEASAILIAYRRSFAHFCLILLMSQMHAVDYTERGEGERG